MESKPAPREAGISRGWARWRRLVREALSRARQSSRRTSVQDAHFPRVLSNLPGYPSIYAMQQRNSDAWDALIALQA